MEEFITEIIVAAISGAISALLTTTFYIKINSKKVSGASTANDVNVTGNKNITSGGNLQM